jgi:hypothetical protein
VEQNFAEEAKKELADEITAIDLDWLAPLIKGRKLSLEHRNRNRDRKRCRE